ncbi:hypothetical protein C7974DRAFT_405086 [Boeremia exigua]|uniref:uncharacterized protein n=1 Tax=Boeremia exigua TaxID=749465 RepID=UPI001E8D9537|nr:uncharacterized protein C7974DRAFT_405086 [Boeremia exigua]KAH6613053.1 hypothetical protein C7974DRAFT_405086 [Boeremia exigua]
MPRGRPRKPVSPCRFCQLTFKRAEHLSRHERTHTQEKPFRCGCGQAFSRKDLLARHTRLSHAGVQERCPNDVENSLIANGLQEQEFPAMNAHATVSRPASPGQSQDSVQPANPRPGFADMTTSISDIPHESSGIHGPSSAQSIPVPDNMQRGHEEQILTGFTNQVHDQSNPIVPPQHLGNIAPGAFNDVDFLWDWDLSAHDFLPATFFDSEQPLSDLWRLDIPQYNLSTALDGLPVMQDVGVQQSAIALPLYERLPPLEPDYELPNNERLPIQDLRPSTMAVTQPSPAPTLPWNISIQSYKSTCDAFLPYVCLVDDTFSFPSRRTLSRFLEAYFQEFHQHFPFLHVPTTTVSALAPELVLAMAAAGGCYRFEDKKWHSLYAASKAIIMHKINASVVATGHSFPPRVMEPEIDGLQPETITARVIDCNALQTMQALAINTALASWSGKPMTQEALMLSSQLAMLVREGGISIDDQIAEGTEWLEWIHREERRRTLFVAYVLFNMQSIAFNVPPAIWNQDVCLCLPHCGSEWEATNASQFMRLRRIYGHDERLFKVALEEILHGRSVHTIGPLSAFGNYVLIVGLIQQIFLERHVLRSLSSRTLSLSSENLKSYEAAFMSWHQSWEATQESSLDPSSPKGPLGFDAAAILWLGYIRLNADMGPHRNLMSKDPQIIARAFVSKDVLRLTRSSHLDRAVLQCIHALCRPVRIGIPFVARTLASKRSVQHALCNLECACLLSRWLNTIAEFVAEDGIQSLREDERSLLGMVAGLIKETDFASILDQNEDDARTIRRMAATSVRLWAGAFSSSHVFRIIDVIGTTLTIMADMLETSLE